MQDIKKLQACKTAKILTAFLILHKKKQELLLIFLTMLTQTDYVIISFLNTIIEKKWSLENRMPEDRWVAGYHVQSRQDETLTQVFLAHLVRFFFLNKTTQDTLVMLYRKFLRKKTIILKLGLL